MGIFFPSAAKLTSEGEFSITRDSIVNMFNGIILLKQLTKLVNKCNHFSFIKMMELLCFTPNVHTLLLKSMPFNGNVYTSIRQSETFRLAFSISTITNVTFEEKCTLEKLQLLVVLCPRPQNLTINTCTEGLESIILFLLERTNHNTLHLLSLCFLRLNDNWSEKLNTLIKSETVLNNYLLKLFNHKLYLCWSSLRISAIYLALKL